MQETSEAGLVVLIALFMLAVVANIVMKFFSRSVLMSILVIILTLLGIGVTIGYYHKAGFDYGIGESLALWGAVLLCVSIFLDKRKIKSTDEPVNEEENDEQPTSDAPQPTPEASTPQPAQSAMSIPAPAPKVSAPVAEESNYYAEDDGDEQVHSRSNLWWFLGAMLGTIVVGGIAALIILGQQKKHDVDEDEDTEMVTDEPEWDALGSVMNDGINDDVIEYKDDDLGLTGKSAVKDYKKLVKKLKKAKATSNLDLINEVVKEAQVYAEKYKDVKMTDAQKAEIQELMKELR